MEMEIVHGSAAWDFHKTSPDSIYIFCHILKSESRLLSTRPLSARVCCPQVTWISFQIDRCNQQIHDFPSFHLFQFEVLCLRVSCVEMCFFHCLGGHSSNFIMYLAIPHSCNGVHRSLTARRFCCTSYGVYESMSLWFEGFVDAVLERSHSEVRSSGPSEELPSSRKPTTRNASCQKYIGFWHRFVMIFTLLILQLLVDMPAHQPRYPVGWNAGFSCFCRGCPCWNVSMCQVVVTQPSQQHSSFSETIPSIAGNHACLLYFPAAWAYHQTEQNATHVKI